MGPPGAMGGAPPPSLMGAGPNGPPFAGGAPPGMMGAPPNVNSGGGPPHMVNGPASGANANSQFGGGAVPPLGVS